MSARRSAAGQTQRTLKKGRNNDATGLLRQVQEEGRNQEPTEYHPKEQAACYQWHMPHVWDKGIQDREDLESAQVPYLAQSGLLLPV